MKTEIVLNCTLNRTPFNFFLKDGTYYAKYKNDIYNIDDNKIMSGEITGTPMNIVGVSICSEDKLVKPSEMKIG